MKVKQDQHPVITRETRKVGCQANQAEIMETASGVGIGSLANSLYFSISSCTENNHQLLLLQTRILAESGMIDGYSSKQLNRKILYAPSRRNPLNAVYIRKQCSITTQIEIERGNCGRWVRRHLWPSVVTNYTGTIITLDDRIARTSCLPFLMVRVYCYSDLGGEASNFQNVKKSLITESWS